MRQLTPALLGVLLLLAACAGQPPAPTSGIAWSDQRLRLQQLVNWQASGKLAVITAERSESASLAWQQRGELSELQLSGPIGVGATSIRSDGRQLEIRRGAEVETHLLDDTGGERYKYWDLPVRELPYWLRGIPAPGSKPRELVLKNQLPASFQQSGWHISYQSHGEFDGYPLPTSLRVERDDTRARLIIRQWSVDGAP